MRPQYKHLTLEDRIEIEKYRDDNLSVREIARRLGRDPSTICRELKRGSWRPSNENPSYTPYRDRALHGDDLTPVQYRAGRAQKKADTRAARSHQPTALTSDRAVTHVVSKLRDGWTPEMIAGRARIDFPDDRSMWACPETIYRFIYDPANRHRQLAQYLPKGHKKRRKHHGRRVYSTRIPNRVSIHHRPEDVNERRVFGHWEGDSVLGVKSVGDAIHTEVERHSRMMAATKVTSLTSRDGVNAQKRLFGQLPAHARGSTTMGNGTEMHLHTELRTDYAMDTYFADPYSS